MDWVTAAPYCRHLVGGVALEYPHCVGYLLHGDDLGEIGDTNIFYTVWRHSLLGGMPISPHTYVLDGDLHDMTSTDDPSIEFLSRQRCDGLVLYEGTARLKREQRRSLKLSLLVFLSLFFSFSYFCKIPRLRCRV